MRTLICAGLAMAGLGGAVPAFAGSWSIQGGDQHFDLNSGRSAVDSRDGYFLGASYWFAPDLAADVSISSSDDVNIDPSLVIATLRVRSLQLGARKEWTVAPQWTIDATAGADLLHVDRELPRTEPIIVDPEVGIQGSTISFYRHRRQDVAPYLGIGVGWHPDPAWSISLDARRSLTQVGVACHYSGVSLRCSDDEQGHVDTLRLGFEYHFH